MKLLTKILSVSLPVLLAAFSALATELTVSSETLQNWRFGGSTAKLRIVANQQFLTSDSKIIMQGNLNTGVWYKDITCTVSGGTLTIPETSLDSTTDSSVNNATYTAQFFDSTGRTRLAVFLASFKVPHSLGTTLSWTQILTYNNGRAIPPLPVTYYTADQTDSLIANLTTIQEVADMIADGTTTVTSSQTANKVFASPNGSSGVPSWRALVAGDIPSLDAAKITSGTFSTSLIPGLDVAKITSGTFADSFIPSLAASKITSGTLAAARLGSGSASSSTYLRGDGTWAAGNEKDLSADYSNSMTALAAESAELTVNCSAAITVSVNATLPKNIHLRPTRGCAITVASGVTLTVGTFVDPGNVKVFTTTGTGKVLFSKGATDEIKIAWWVGNTSGADITDALSEAVESANASQMTVSLPTGLWTTTAGVTLSDSVIIKGTGNNPTAGNATTLKLVSPTTSYLLKIGEGEYGVRLSDLILDGTGTTSKDGLLLEGTYPNSSGDLEIRRVTFSNFNNGINFNSLGGSWQFAQVKLDQCIFQNNTTGIKTNSVNSSWQLNSTNFAIPNNGWAVNASAAPPMTFISPEFACTGIGNASNVMKLTGSHGAITFIASQDEGCDTFLQNDASDIAGIVNIYSSLVQSRILINQSMRLNSYGSNYPPDTFRIAVGALPYVTSQNDNVRTDTGTWEAPGTYPVSPLRLQKTDAPYTTQSIIQLENDQLSNEYRTRWYQRFYAPEYFDGSPTNPLVIIGHQTGSSESKALLELCRLDSTQVCDYGYTFKRINSGNEAGYLDLSGNQTGYIGLKFNGEFAAAGAVRSGAAQLTDAATVTITPKNGNHQYVTLGGNRTLAMAAMDADEQTRADGQRITIEIIQDATGSRTCTLSTAAGSFLFGTDIPSVTCSTTASATDILEALYSKRKNKWLVIRFTKGF